MSQKSHSEGYFLEALLKGDLAETERALQELLAKDSATLNRSLMYHARRFGVRLDPQTFEDLYMDAVVNILRSSDRLKDVDNLGGYVWAIGRNTVASLQRRSLKIEKSEVSFYEEMLDEKDAEHLRYKLVEKPKTRGLRSPHLYYPDRLTDRIAAEEELQMVIAVMLVCLYGEQGLAGILGLQKELGTLTTKDIKALTGWSTNKFSDQKRRAYKKVKGWMELLKKGFSVPASMDNLRDFAIRGKLCPVAYGDSNVHPHLEQEALRAIGLGPQELGPERNSNSEYLSNLLMFLDHSNPETYYKTDPKEWLSLEVLRRDDYERLRIAVAFGKEFRYSRLDCGLDFGEGEIRVSESSETLHEAGQIEGPGQHVLFAENPHLWFLDCLLEF